MNGINEVIVVENLDIVLVYGDIIISFVVGLVIFY